MNMEPSEATKRVDVALAAQLRKRRLELKFSQASLAAELGVDQSFVSRVELGERCLTFGQALKWLSLLYPNQDQLLFVLLDLSKKSVIGQESFWQLEEHF